MKTHFTTTAFLLLTLLPGCASPRGGDSPQNPSLPKKIMPNTPSLDSLNWLEDVQGEAALNWVRARNARSLGELEKDAKFETLHEEIRSIVLAKDRIPMPMLMGESVYNYWQDPKQVRGIWRRTSPKSFASKAPQWETILDLDALAAAEKENWVWHGAACLPPAYERCLVTLSRGGKDASVVREFDLKTKSFIPAAQGGFELPEAKSRVAWADADTLWVATDFGSDSLTESGYPRTVRLWKRGTDLSRAPELFAGQRTDVSASGYTDFRPEGQVTIFSRSPSFFEEESWVYRDSKAQRIPLPTDASLVGVIDGFFLAQLRSDWSPVNEKFEAGSVVALPVATLDLASAELVFKPSATQAVEAVVLTRSRVLVTLLDNVEGRILSLKRTSKGWKGDRIALPGQGAVGVVSAESFSEAFITQYSGFLTPVTLYQHGTAGAPKVLKQAPSRFDSKPYQVSQRFAVSKDGTRVPYFVVEPKAKPEKGPRPTLLYGYGGFEVPMKPAYIATWGKSWLSRGGRYVLANIRGGGEFGPKWHQAALLKNRQKAFDDFAAVAEDLAKVDGTTRERLGIMGGSNGGLLVGASFTQRPELFGAVVCQVPLLDMLRYRYLLAGASWMAEYGDPEDTEMRAVLSSYSPLHNLKPSGKYPRVFFVTSTADDRVHPGHARKMAALMEEQGHPYLLFENIEGGHGASANLEQEAKRRTLEMTYLMRELKGF